MDELLTVAEVAGRLKLNQQTVRNWIDRNELPSVRLGARRVRIRQSDLDAFIEAGSKPAPGEPVAEVVDEVSIVAWTSFGAAMASATATLENEDREGLVDVLRSLAEATQDLADALARSDS